MPRLSCSAQSCIHNNSNFCCRGEIDVAGNGAETSEGTCCSSFYEDTGNARDAMEQTPTEYMNVQCQAQNCTHNEGCKCHAESIDVSGYGAGCSDETCCSSFEKQ